MAETQTQQTDRIPERLRYRPGGRKELLGPDVKVRVPAGVVATNAELEADRQNRLLYGATSH